MIWIVSAMMLAAPPVKPGEQVVAELGLPEIAGLPELLSVKYQADGVSIEDVKKVPEKYPLRIAVLNAAEVLRQSHKLKVVEEVWERRVDTAKKEIADFQEDLASSILRLREASEDLQKAALKRKSEPSLRWQMHLDYLLAATRFRAGTLEELNLVYGRLHRSEVPAVKEPNTGWKLAPEEKMHSKPDIRRMVEESRDDFEAIVKAHPGSPWAKLAERELEFKPGLAWNAAVVKPPPAKVEMKKKK